MQGTFRKYLKDNRETPQKPATPQVAEEDLDISIEPSPNKEDYEAIRAFKNGKAPDQDQLMLSSFKCHPELTAKILPPTL